MVGLFFFIRASVKDRTETAEWMAALPEEDVLTQVESYLKDRAYRLIALEPEKSQVTFEGLVRPSLILALFLTGLMLVALLCLSLVLSVQFPVIGLRFLVLIALSPLSGWFYWQRAKRPEQVNLTVKSLVGEDDSRSVAKTLLTVMAHRDELSAMRARLKFPSITSH
ncbi:MAG: cofactor assembly of complex C subunit B [Acaryochloridaceae cyanobacterium SU_2_1]|nr:cofactor assembly of complex C subunit B [Acaryochloridaceae cyanobacterium SU_2_1]